jgi:antitoxin (DNA-binding transcriptional repressor) of toxin-antitoxin stability system
MAKDVIHVSEAEAASNLTSLMARVRAGAKVIIENGERPMAVLHAAEPVRRSIETDKNKQRRKFRRANRSLLHKNVSRAAIVPTENFVWSTLVPAGTHVTMPLVAGEITIRQPQVRPIMEVLAAKDCGIRRETASAERLTDRENHVRKSVYNSDVLIKLS